MHYVSKFFLSTTTALGSAYCMTVAWKVAPTYRYNLSESNRLPKDFNESYAVTKHGNPRNHVAFNHSMSVVVRIPSSSSEGRQSLTDEQLLVRMLKGYYGGWVIAPERWAFAAVQADMVHFEGVPRPEVTWSPARSLQENLPPLHHVLIGAFQILDTQIVGESNRSNSKDGKDSEPPLLGLEGIHAVLSTTESSTTTTSYVDLGFGDNQGTFSGINRFAVTTLPESESDDNDDSTPTAEGRLVRLTMSALACNPTQNAMTTSKWVFKFHEPYAVFLFREGVGRVLADC